VLSAETTDEADARRMFDEMMIHDHERDDICMKGVHQQGLAASTDDDSPTRWWRQMGRSSTCTSTGSGSDGTVDLHALLLQCAQAMATDDLLTAHGHWCTSAATPQPRVTPRRGWRTASRRAWRHASPIRAATSATRSCSAAPPSRTSSGPLHGCCKIVDYGLGNRFQWPDLLRVLTTREGSPPKLLRIPGIDLPHTAYCCRSGRKVLSVASFCFECMLSRWIGNGGWRLQESYNVTLLCKVTQSGSQEIEYAEPKKRSIAS